MIAETTLNREQRDALNDDLRSTGVLSNVSTPVGTAPQILFQRWATLALLFVPVALLFITLFAMPFNSPAFIIDFWTSAVMMILAIPRRESV